MRTITITALALAAGVGITAVPATAGIMLELGGGRGFQNITNTEDFQGYAEFEFPGTPFSSPSGFDFALPGGGQFVIWGAGGVGFPTNSLYQNGGAPSMTSISLTDGSDINQIEFQTGNGFGPADPHNVWVRAYNDGAPAGFDFDLIDLPVGETITVFSEAGTVFDELRVQSYGSSPIEHDESQFGALSIDNIVVGQGVPAPGALALLALGSLATRRRRR